MTKIVVVGGGNLAESVAVAVAQSSGLELCQIYLRSAERGEELHALTGAPYATFEEELAQGDIYLLAVSDGAIGELSHKLNFATGAIVAHTAGSVALGALNPALRRAVFYPLQSFTRGRRVDFSMIPIFVEAECPDVLAQISCVADALSRRVVALGSEQRCRLHLSAVFVCNFVNAMFSTGEELVSESGLPFDILKPLIEECCAKACEASSPRLVQTGPAVRGDIATQERHIEMLGDKENLKEIYQIISKYIWETSKRI